MNKKILLTTLLVLLLLLSSCSFQGGGFTRFNKNPAKYLTRAGVDYHQGTDALVFNFLDESPPQYVFEGAEFDVQAHIHNKGAFDVAGNRAATIVLTYDDNLIERITDQSPNIYIQDGNIQIHGRSYYFPYGEQNYFPLERFRVKPFDTLHESKSIKFTATLTYPYQTHFSQPMCVDTDPENVGGRREACHVSDITSSGQGAPLAITQVQSQMVPRGYYVQPQFLIHIENRGGGLVWNYDENNLRAGAPNDVSQIIPWIVDMTSSLEPNIVQVRAHLGVDELICTPVYLKEGKADIQCVLPFNSIAGSAANYMTTLSVNLSYFYQETFSKEVEVRRATIHELEQITNNDYCAPWETLSFKDGQQACVTNCELQARDNYAVLRAKGLRGKDNFSQYVGCIYTSDVICRSKEGSCLVEESRGLCPTGQYCGWPSCLDNNYPPYFDKGHVWIEGDLVNGNVVFVCKDADDYYDKLGVCDCADKAYYTYKEDGERCEEIEFSRFTFLPGTYSREYGAKFTLPGAASQRRDICVILEDKQGARSQAEPIFRYIR